MVLLEQLAGVDLLARLDHNERDFFEVFGLLGNVKPVADRPHNPQGNGDHNTLKPLHEFPLFRYQRSAISGQAC